MPPETKTSNNEIDQALKQFDTESAAEQGTYKAVKFYDETDAPKMVQLVMKWSGGAIKEQKHAEYILFGIVIIMLGASLYFFFGGLNKHPKLSAAEIERLRSGTMLNQ